MTSAPQSIHPGMAQQLRDHAASDHKRGCMGRQYSCTCKYDSETEALLLSAADRLEFAEFEWNRATAGMQERDAEIATLTARVEELELALRPFANFANRFGETAREDSWQLTNNPSGKGNLTMGDCRSARAALTTGQPK